MASFRSDGLAQQIKDRLTMDEVARHYGFEPNRSGFLRCPFHQGDHTASMKIYHGSGGFHCFGCGVGGSVIDFVMRLFGINFRQACVRLNSDFSLGLTGERPSRAEVSALMEARHRTAEKRADFEQEYREKAAEHRYWWDVLKYFAPKPGENSLHPLYAEALMRQPILEYWLDEHLGG